MSKVIKHPNFITKPYLWNDIGLLVTNFEIQFSEYIKPACLRTEFGYPSFVGSKGHVVGFGQDENGYLNENLSAISLAVVSRLTCIDKDLYYGSQSEISTYCAGNSSSSAVCPGERL